MMAEALEPVTVHRQHHIRPHRVRHLPIPGVPNRRPRPGGRTTRGLVQAPWVPGRLSQRRLPGAAVAELRYLRLADHDRASRLDPLDHLVILIGDEVGVGVRAGGRAHTLVQRRAYHSSGVTSPRGQESGRPSGLAAGSPGWWGCALRAGESCRAGTGWCSRARQVRMPWPARALLRGRTRAMS